MFTLLRFLKSLYTFSKSKVGFTLVEATASVAIIGTIAAIALPIAIDKIDQSKKSTADGDTKDIATALTQLIYDVGLDNLGKRGAVTRLGLTVSGGLVGTTDPLDSDGVGTYNDDAGGIWATTKDGAGAAWVAVDVGSFHDHLVVNNLDGDATISETGTDDYPSTWKGPYLSDPKFDPWGRSYVSNLQGIREGVPAANPGGTFIFGWVLSAGPNNKLETDDTASALGGDDRGIMLFKK